MKNLIITAIFLVPYALKAQDSTPKWNFSTGINLTSIPTQYIKGTDTAYHNTLSVSPFISLRSKGGFGFIYTPWFLTGGSNPGIYINEATVGLEQYDKKKFDIVADYNHYFFTGNSSVTTSPLTNEILLDLTYKEWWLRPKIAAGFGFGTNKEDSASQFAFDVELEAGVSHSVDWTGNKDFSFNITPSLFVNAGTNEYFSFLKLSKYITHSNNLKKIIKNIHASNKGRGRGNSTTPSAQNAVSNETLSVNNLELNLEATIEHGSFSIRPSSSLYIPFAKSNTVTGYWELNFSYYF